MTCDVCKKDVEELFDVNLRYREYPKGGGSRVLNATEPVKVCEKCKATAVRLVSWWMGAKAK